MGVINNLIAIRRKFHAIVGANWDGTTIADILADRPKIEITRQPVSVTSGITSLECNIMGYFGTLRREDGSYAGSFNTATRTLSIPQQSDGRYYVEVACGNLNAVKSTIFSFGATTQNLSAKQNMSESLETDVIKEDLTTDETPVVEKTTTTTKKG